MSDFWRDISTLPKEPGVPLLLLHKSGVSIADCMWHFDGFYIIKHKGATATVKQPKVYTHWRHK